MRYLKLAIVTMLASCFQGGKGSGDTRADAGDSDVLSTDAAPFSCSNDGELEPNDSLASSTALSIPELQNAARIVGLAVCPSGDEDFFRFGIEINATDATVEIEYVATQGALAVDLLNDSGAVVQSGLPVNDNPNHLRASTPSLPIGTYYARVRSDVGAQNNYDLEVTTTP